MAHDKTNGWERREDMEAQLLPFINRQIGVAGSCKMVERLRCYTKGECRVIIAEESWDPNRPLRTHMSISCVTRLPTWEEQKDARYSLCGLGVWMAQFLPPSTEYVNVHPYTMHWWEVPKPEGVS